MKFAKLILCALSVVAICGMSSAAVKVSAVTSKGKVAVIKEGGSRSGGYTIKQFPAEFKGLEVVSVPRGNPNKAGNPYSFTISAPATVYIMIDARQVKNYKLEGWTQTKLTATWIAGKSTYKDVIFKKDFAAGTVAIPANPRSGLPCLAVIKGK